MKPLVSVIMPVYNSEDYLDESVESVLNQRDVDLELICVDDGSTDGTHVILEKWRIADSRVVLLTQPNRGQGVARNRGLDVARGDIVYFMDSDDILGECALSRVTTRMRLNRLDLLLFEGSLLIEDGHTHDEGMYTRSKEYQGIWDGSELYLEQVANGDYIVSPCMGAARLAFLKEANVRFAEGVIHEDEQYSFFALIHARRVGVIKDRMYIRRYRAGSTMTSLERGKSLRGYLTVLAEVERYVPDDDTRGRARRIRLDGLYRTCASLIAKMGMSSGQAYVLCVEVLGDGRLARGIANDPRVRLKMLYGIFTRLRTTWRSLATGRRRGNA